MKQQTLAGFAKYAKTTRRAKVLAEMDRVMPWGELVAVVEPYHPKVSAERPSAGAARAHAAPLLPATVVQPLRPCDRGGPLRLELNAREKTHALYAPVQQGASNREMEVR